jgi:GNAT superfamily N-acetyltransferase
MKIEDIKAVYSSDPDGFVAHLGQELGINVIDYEVVHDNQGYQTLIAFLPALLCDHPLLGGYESVILTANEQESGYSLRLRNSITLSLADGSYLQFGPDDDGGVELIVLYVVPAHQRRGIGTYLMYMLFALMLLSGEWPTISTNVTDKIGDGATVVNSSVEVQVRFFKSLGFVVRKQDKKLCKLIRPAGQEFFISA